MQYPPPYANTQSEQVFQSIGLTTSFKHYQPSKLGIAAISCWAGLKLSLQQAHMPKVLNIYKSAMKQGYWVSGLFRYSFIEM